MKSLAVIIPAAGSGSRMGTRIPKPFLKINGVAILEHTVRAFSGLGCVNEIIIATSEEWKEDVRDLLQRAASDITRAEVVSGGKERQDSIYNALKVVSGNISLVAVHDAVRPFLSADIILKCIDRAEESGGAIVAVPAKDTIKKVGNDNVITETPDRSFLWQAQTPQIFRKEVLLSAYDKAQEEGFMGTDDASLVERYGGKVEVVEGDRRNLKITYPVDLKVAQMILNEGEAP